MMAAACLASLFIAGCGFGLGTTEVPLVLGSGLSIPATPIDVPDFTIGPLDIPIGDINTALNSLPGGGLLQVAIVLSEIRLEPTQGNFDWLNTFTLELRTNTNQVATLNATPRAQGEDVVLTSTTPIDLMALINAPGVNTLSAKFVIGGDAHEAAVTFNATATLLVTPRIGC